VANTDDGFHEIQLNGKQLVFLFMAATVVSVVIFLFGVLVGRGVRVERSGVAEAAAGGIAAETVPQQPPQTTASTPAGSDPTAAAPPPATQDDLSYYKRLEKPQPPAEELKPRKKEATDPTPTAGRNPAPSTSSAPKTQSAPGGDGFAVQIAALNVRSEADAIAKRLTSKGYAAYVVPPPDGTPTIYRVRVGKFPTRREAETIAAKLQKEEQLKPWVTR
jgi:DedD protein